MGKSQMVNISRPQPPFEPINLYNRFINELKNTPETVEADRDIMDPKKRL